VYDLQRRYPHELRSQIDERVLDVLRAAAAAEDEEHGRISIQSERFPAPLAIGCEHGGPHRVPRYNDALGMAKVTCRTPRR